jgi:glutamate-1-semialdehyde 2,1-aminomutase
MNNYKDRLLRAIPGGAHTYSRGFDQYPENSPAILERGEGAYTYDTDGNKYLDYGMALRAVNLGYANKEVNQAAIKQIKNGNKHANSTATDICRTSMKSPATSSWSTLASTCSTRRCWN